MAKKKVSKDIQDILDEIVRVEDMMFANAVKVGVSQTNYFSSQMYDIVIRGNVVEIRKKDWPAESKSVFTTLYNVIHWRAK
jgi:phage tail tube protein FII